MSIKSNELKDIPFPNDFNDEDKLEYEKLLNESKVIHPDIYNNERWIIHYGIIMFIRTKKGIQTPYSDEELQKIIDNYKINVKEVKCNGDELPYLYDKENNPIFKDDSYFFKNNEEGNVAETKAEDKVEIEILNSNIYLDKDKERNNVE